MRPLEPTEAEIDEARGLPMPCKGGAGPWTCFQCGETYHTEEDARGHFGIWPHRDPACVQRLTPEQHARAVELAKAEKAAHDAFRAKVWSERMAAAYAVRGNRIAELEGALRTIAEKQGKCLLGPVAAECCELSYQTGSNAAFNDCAGEALSALRSPEAEI